MSEGTFEKRAIESSELIENLLNEYAEVSAKYSIEWREYRKARDALAHPDVWHPLAVKAEQTKNALDKLKKQITKLRNDIKKKRTKTTQQHAEILALESMSKSAIDFMADQKTRIIPPSLSRRIIREAERQGSRKRASIKRTLKQMKSDIIHCVMVRENRPIDLELTDVSLSRTVSMAATTYGVSKAFKPLAQMYTALLINKEQLPVEFIGTKEVQKMKSVLVRKDIMKQLGIQDAPFMYVTQELAELLKKRLAFVEKIEGYLPPFIDGNSRNEIVKLNGLIAKV